MVTKRIDRKQLLKEPDEFFTTTGRFINWVKAHPRHVTYAACAFLVLVLAVTGFRYFNQRRAQSASNLLSQILIDYQQELAKSDAQGAYKTVAPDFNRLISEYSGQSAGRLGTIYYAHFSAAAQDTDTAIALYQKALNRFGKDASLANVITLSLARAFEQKGDSSAAIDHYRRITEGNHTLHKADALFQLGRLYRQTGAAEKSRQVLEQLSRDFPDSIYAEPAAEMAAG